MVGKLTNDAMMSCSRLPALLGLSPWSSPNDELQKSFKALNNLPKDDWNGNEATRMGDKFEPIILGMMQERLGLDILIQPDAPYHAPPGIALSGSLDGVAGMIPSTRKVAVQTDVEAGIYVMTPSGEMTLDGNGCFECKLTSNRPEEEPAAYRGPIQLQGQMLCSGFKWGAVGVLYQGIELRIFVYPRNDEKIREIIAAVEEFEKRKHGPDFYAPQNPADGIRTYGTVEQGAPPIDLDPVAITLMDEIINAKKLAKIAQDTIDDCTAGLMDLLGNHETGIARDSDGSTWTVKWPTRHYKAAAAKTTPAKEAYSIRLKSLTIKVADASGKETEEA
jgi:hypothetical protein